MACVNLEQMLAKAKKGKYAVGAFNILDYSSMLAVIRSAEELEAPIIVQTSVKTVLFWGYKVIALWYRQLSEQSPVPVALHLDHCKDMQVLKSCIDSGWTSVMIDASSKPFEENLAITREVVGIASRAGVSVEAELGEISGVEDDIALSDQDDHLTDPDKAVQFCEGLRVAVFAPAIGTAHGLYKGEPKLDFTRLEQIAGGTNLPIALHGGTGLSDEVFRKCISMGCAKINISTMLKHTFIDSFLEYRKSSADDYNPLNYLRYQFDQIKDTVKRKIRLFGGEGKSVGWGES